ncbi:squalene/phytoene synthase family protein [Calidifontibacillus erzurumensis]|uniref:squalene/phytoene synthase family protein n=1 Tax=Calidifontibacillus erzurumensis TaxID=2741433 RepID=UPI0035B50057
MKETNVLLQEAQAMLIETSRTFAIPISRLEGKLNHVVMASYLCMRSIDEIEDHLSLPNDQKIFLLQSVAKQVLNEKDSLFPLFAPFTNYLPEVTLRIDDWLKLIPDDISADVRFFISKMAKGMAKWTERNWQIETEEDLDDYTYVVAGLVGELLSVLWQWHDQIETDRQLAISFGRGLQAVNIIRNKSEDQERGVSFYPKDWTQENMIAYAKKQLAQADKYIASIKPKHIYEFCSIPLALAYGTLQVIENNQEKLKRDEVINIVNTIIK